MVRTVQEMTHVAVDGFPRQVSLSSTEFTTVPIPRGQRPRPGKLTRLCVSRLIAPFGAKGATKPAITQLIIARLRNGSPSSERD